MLTNNGKKYILGLLNNYSNLYPGDFIKVDGSAGSGASTIKPVYINSAASIYDNEGETSQNAYTFRMCVGSGSSQADETKYCLDNAYTKNDVSAVSSSLDFKFYEGASRLIFTMTLTNISGGNLTINEAGLYFSIPSQSYTVLVAREVLDTPLVVPDGDTFTISMMLM